MTSAYRLFGAETSAYSTKIRSFMRYKGVEFDWMPRTQENEEELKKLSRFPTLPVLVTESGFAVHDTTPMIEALEADTPEPSAQPEDPTLAFLAAVLEEYADTWLAKAAFHYRWTRKKDQKLAAQRAVSEYFGDEVPENHKQMEEQAIERMGAELKAVGLDGDLGGVIEKSFKKFVKLLNEHLRQHLFLFGGRPTIADFAIGGQLIQMMKDPTPAKIIEKDGEFVAKWCEFLNDPKAGGPFEALDDLKETLAPIFTKDLSVFFLPWAAENLENSLSGSETFSVTLGKETLELKPIKSAGRSFRDLRKRFLSAQENEALKAFTDDTKSTEFLQRPASVSRRGRGRQDVDAEGNTNTDEAQTSEEGNTDEPRRRRRRRRKGSKSEDSAETAKAETSEEASETESTETAKPTETTTEAAPETGTPEVEAPVDTPDEVPPAIDAETDDAPSADGDKA